MTGPTRRDDRSHQGGSAAIEGPRQFPPHHAVKRTRTGTVWFTAASFAVILALLLIFILENDRKVEISFLGAHGHLPLGVALLFAAVLGILLAVVPGTARIIQLRILAHRHRAIDAGSARGAPEGTPEPADATQPRPAGRVAADGSSPAQP